MPTVRVSFFSSFFPGASFLAGFACLDLPATFRSVLRSIYARGYQPEHDTPAGPLALSPPQFARRLLAVRLVVTRLEFLAWLVATLLLKMLSVLR
jgi:hypothetical protein